jgi:hypothetical protein
MQRALHATSCSDLSAREKPMPERAYSFAPTIPGVFSVFVTAMAVHFCSPVRADSACLDQPSQPAAEGTRWSAHYDRTKGRKCWVLVDASTSGRDAAAPQAQPNAASISAPVETLSSQIASLLGNLTGASANVTPQATAPQAGAPGAPRKPQGNAARTDQRAEGHAVKRVNPALTQPEREALFEEFLRWQRNEDTLSTLLSGPASR